MPWAWPVPSVSRSPWYQEIPNVVLGTWVTNKSKSVFFGRWLAETFITSTGPCDGMVTLASAPLRQLALTAVAERTMWNVAWFTAASAQRGAGHSGGGATRGEKRRARYRADPFG